MSFDSIIGQRKAKKILTRALQQKRVPHAYLFYGGPGVGKEALALELAKALLCQTNGTEPCDQCSHCSRVAKLTHPDLVYLFPAPQTIKPEEHQLVLQSLIKDPYYRLRLWANPSISIERIRELRRTSAYKSFEGRGRVIIIAEADTMTIEASNALLKILEEPPEKMNLILTTSNVTQILPTITSRCQMIRFEPLSYQDIETALIKRKKLEPEPARLIARLASGNFRRALELLQEDLPAKRQMVINVLRKIVLGDLDRLLLVENLVSEGDKIYIKDLLNLLLVWFRDVLIFREWGDEPSLSEKLVNVDQQETMKRYLAACESIEFEKIIFELEHALELIDKNINVTLILIVLFDHLRKYMWRKTNV